MSDRERIDAAAQALIARGLMEERLDAQGKLIWVLTDYARSLDPHELMRRATTEANYPRARAKPLGGTITAQGIWCWM